MVLDGHRLTAGPTTRLRSVDLAGSNPAAPTFYCHPGTILQEGSYDALVLQTVEILTRRESDD